MRRINDEKDYPPFGRQVYKEVPRMGFLDFFYPSEDNLLLHGRVYGEKNLGRPVVCLPGINRNVRDFHELALYLSTALRNPRKVIALDYRGRGRSANDENISNYNITVEARDVLTGLDFLGVEEAAFIGTSRGGLVIHILAVLKPSILKAVVLNDSGPKFEPQGLAEIKTRIDQAPWPKSFAEAVEKQQMINATDFPSFGSSDWKRLVTCMYRETEDGTLVPDLDLKLLARLTAENVKPLPDLWEQFQLLSTIPLLVVRGENSRLISTAIMNEMHYRHSGMEAITVLGQGHPPLLETGDLPKIIADFIDRSEARK
ncbi:alpha/beta fold hydrolase [Mesorhizobium sp. NPDC059054]|uniref:alpha/beta fold hydrolase n=1 Tax=Mesorhizobium sp. NPDC059054 TaxID=3346711 RepID=UPI003685372C